MQLGNLHIAFVDVAAIAILIVFLVRGMMKGFVSQLTLLMTLVGGLFVAKWLSPHIQPSLKRWLGERATPTNHLDFYLSYVIVFLAFLVVIGLVARMLQGAVARYKLESYNRSFGALIGLLLGAGVIVIAVVCVSHMGWPEADRALNGSYTARYSYHTLNALAPIFPDQMQEKMSAYLKPLQEAADDKEEEAARAKTSSAPKSSPKN